MVEILDREFRDVLKQYNSSNVFVYADCPYLDTEDYYKNIFSDKDYEDLPSGIPLEVMKRRMPLMT